VKDEHPGAGHADESHPEARENDGCEESVPAPSSKKKRKPKKKVKFLKDPLLPVPRLGLIVDTFMARALCLYTNCERDVKCLNHYIILCISQAKKPALLPTIAAAEEQLPWTLAHSQRLGRHAIAKHDLEAGDILVLNN
jgi:hypothetical protein